MKCIFLNFVVLCLSSVALSEITVNFLNQGDEAEVEESQPPGTFVAHVLVSSDMEASCYISRSSDVVALVQLTSNEYEVLTTTAFDAEEEIIYEVLIECQDREDPSETSVAGFIMRIMDMNDNTPVIQVNTLTAEGEAIILENSPIGEFVAHVAVIDADSGLGGVVDCALVDSNIPVFQMSKIMTNEYKVMTNVVLDAEVTSQLEFKVRCQDRGSPPRETISRTQVIVDDMNDNPPVFSVSAYRFNIPSTTETGSLAGVVQAVDMDQAQKNSFVSYGLQGACKDLVTIDEESGDIRVQQNLEKEVGSMCQSVVTAIDYGEPSLTGTADLTIYVVA